MNLQYDWKKYKRVFAFGCSFTRFWYPTWANLIFNETSNSACYNFAAPGMGNLAIASRVAEANTKFEFNETDLILVMYTSPFREDRWIDGRWRSHGCVYNQRYYDNNFVKNYVDPVGCLIRDLSLIELSSKYIDSLSCDSLILKSSELYDDGGLFSPDSSTKSKDVITRYRKLWDSFPPSLKETVFPNGWVTRKVHIKGNKLSEDDHPWPIEYYKYLNSIGVNLGEGTHDYAVRSNNILEENIHQRDCVFNELLQSRSNELF